jgi:hypothetical protein
MLWLIGTCDQKIKEYKRDNDPQVQKIRQFRKESAERREYKAQKEKERLRKLGLDR